MCLLRADLHRQLGRNCEVQGLSTCQRHAGVSADTKIPLTLHKLWTSRQAMSQDRGVSLQSVHSPALPVTSPVALPLFPEQIVWMTCTSCTTRFSYCHLLRAAGIVSPCRPVLHAVPWPTAATEPCPTQLHLSCVRGSTIDRNRGSTDATLLFSWWFRFNEPTAIVAHETTVAIDSTPNRPGQTMSSRTSQSFQELCRLPPT